MKQIFFWVFLGAVLFTACRKSQDSSNSSDPVEESSITAAAGDEHTLIIKEDKSLWACGDNYEGQLGDGTTTSKSNPVKITDNVKTVVARYEHTMIQKLNNSFWSAGHNSEGQLGEGTTTERHLFVPMNLP